MVEQLHASQEVVKEVAQWPEVKDLENEAARAKKSATLADLWKDDDQADKYLDQALNQSPDIFAGLDEQEIKSFQKRKQDIIQLGNKHYGKTLEYSALEISQIRISNFPDGDKFHIDFVKRIWDIAYTYMVDVDKKTDNMSWTVTHIPDKNKPREKVTKPFGSVKRYDILNLMSVMEVIARS